MADERVLIEIEAEDNASSKIDKVSSSIQNLGTSTNNLGRGTGVSEFLNSWETNLHKFNSTMRQYNATMSGINNFTKRMLKDAGAAVWDFTTESVEAYAEFTEQHAKVLGVMANQNEYKITYDDNLDEVSAKQQKFLEDASKLKSQSIQLGTYGIDSQGSLMDISSVSAIQEELLKSGVSSKDILSTDIVQQLMKFSVGNDLSTTEAVDFAVALGSQFGIKPQDWGDMLDKVAHTADVSVIDVADVVQSMKYAGGITAGIDRPLEETLAEIAVLGNFGLKGSQGGTGIQALLTRLLTQDTTVITDAQKEVAPERALKAFYDFSTYAKSDGSGLTYDQIANATSYEELGKLSGNLRPMTEIIDQMDEVMSELNDEEQAWFARKFFGLYQMKAAYGLLNGEETDLQAVIDEITIQSSGTNDNKYSQLLESSYGKKEAFANLMQGIKVDFGERLSPFTDKIYEELTKFLSDPNNYEIDFEGLRQALQDSCDLIEEKYGTAIANAVENIGDFSIDLTQVMTELGPDIIEGVAKMLGSATEGDIVGLVTDWGTMIDNMHASADELPEDLQGLADGITNVIDWLGKLMAFNVATEIAELISSVLQMLTIAGGAMIHVMGGVVVNGSTVTSAGGSSFTQWDAGAGAGSKALLSGETVVGSADDVAKALGTSADDVIKTFGKQATYSIDDVAKGLGTSVDDVISGLGLTTKSVSALSKLGKGLSVVGIGIEAVTTGIDAYNAFSSGDNKGGTEEIFGGIGSIGGGLGGAKIGSIIGTTIAPGIGTAIGGVIGAIGGALLGDYVGEQSGGFIYDITNPGETTNEYQKLTNKGEKYKKQLEDLQSKLDKLTSAGEGSSIEAYKLKNKIDELTTAFNNMGDVTLVGLIEKSEQLKKVIDDIAEVQEQKEVQADETADQAKSYIATLDSLPDIKDENDMSIAQGIIDKLNQEYDMGITMDETGKYNMTTGEMWDKVNTSVEQTKTDANMEALLGYLTQYQQAQSRYDDANKTMNKEYDDYEYARDNIFKKEHPFLAWTGWADGAEMNWGGTTKQEYEEYKVAKDAVSSAAEEFNKLDEAIRGCYEAMGYTKEEIDNKMADLALSSAKATEENRNLIGNDLNIDNATINITNTSMPDILERVKENTPGWTALSQQGMNDLIQNEINNQIQIDDSVTMTPSFNVAAPNVSVNVHVDQAGNATTTKSILNPGLPSTLNNYYSRTSKQYATQNKK